MLILEHPEIRNLPELKPLRRMGYKLASPSIGGVPPCWTGILNFAWNSSRQPQINETNQANGIRVRFSIYPPLVNGDYEICMDLHPPTSTNLDFCTTKTRWNHWGLWVMMLLLHFFAPRCEFDMCSFFHLSSPSPWWTGTTNFNWTPPSNLK